MGRDGGIRRPGRLGSDLGGRSTETRLVPRFAGISPAMERAGRAGSPSIPIGPGRGLTGRRPSGDGAVAGRAGCRMGNGRRTRAGRRSVRRGAAPGRACGDRRPPDGGPGEAGRVVAGGPEGRSARRRRAGRGPCRRAGARWTRPDDEIPAKVEGRGRSGPARADRPSQSSAAVRDTGPRFGSAFDHLIEQRLEVSVPGAWQRPFASSSWSRAIRRRRRLRDRN